MSKKYKLREKELVARFLKFLKNVPTWEEAENKGIYARIKFDDKKNNYLYFYVSEKIEDNVLKKLEDENSYVNLSNIYVYFYRDDIGTKNQGNISYSDIENAYFSSQYVKRRKKIVDLLIKYIENKNYIDEKNIVFNKELFTHRFNLYEFVNLKHENIYEKDDLLNKSIKKYPDVDKINIEYALEECLKYNFKKIDNNKFLYIDPWEDEENNNLFVIKNIILYGAPGVGKTHNIAKLINLIENEYTQKEIFDILRENELEDVYSFNRKLKQRVKFITFHQSFGYEDFIEGFRPNEDGKIELKKGVFKSICKEAQKNLEDSKKEQSFDIEQFLNDFVSYVETVDNFEIDNNLSIEVNKNSNGEFKSFKTKGRVKNQSLTYEVIKRDFEEFLNGKIKDFKDIKPSFESNRKYHGNALYYFKLYQKMKEFLKDNKDNYRLNNTKLKNYYIVIDEINRANISKVFGELITLIEEDKRDKLEVILPYSKEPFSVPSNLYIIGTMNSTDKSIALLDVALRRRFTFIKMEPNSNLVIEEFKDKFTKLNEFIANTLGEDYKIGHSYFINIDTNDLEFVIDYKIKPLLEEYFYGDKEGLQKALALL